MQLSSTECIISYSVHCCTLPTLEYNIYIYIHVYVYASFESLAYFTGPDQRVNDIRNVAYNDTCAQNSPAESRSIVGQVNGYTVCLPFPFRDSILAGQRCKLQLQIMRFRSWLELANNYPLNLIQ